MADNSVFTVTLKTIADISDVKHNIDALQDSFKKLKLPDKIGDNLRKNISNFMKEYDKYQSKLAQGIQTPGDQRTVNKSLNSMLNSYEHIINEFDNLSKKDFKEIFNLDDGDFKRVQAVIKETQADLKKLKLDPKQLTEPIEQITKLTKAGAVVGNGKGLDKIKIGFDTNNIELAREGIEEIDKYLDRFGSSMKTEKFNAIQNALKPIRDQVAEADSKTANFNKTLEKAENQLKDLGVAGTKGLKDTANKLRESGQEAEKLTDTLKKQHAEEFSFNRQAQDIDRQIQSYFGLSQMIRKVGDIARDAFQTVKELDAAMTETAVVTNFSVSDMWEMLPTYTEQANQLGSTIKDVYEAATLYYQQGLNTNQAMGLANETLKMARIAGLGAAEATDMMTAALRGFNMEINQTSAQKINDIYSELAAITASDTKEIGSAMERTASIANSANMDFATTSAFLAQMIETTREAPENLGTAMKTIVARFQEMKKDPTALVDSEGVAMDVNKVDAALKTIGVNLTNTKGEFRDLDDVFLDISARWSDLTQGQQRYIATIAAGSRQQSRFIAMMSNYERTMELVDAANNSAGASQKQFEKTLDSMSSKLNQLKNAWDQFAMGLMNNQIIKFGVDALTEGFTVVNKLIDLLGKLPPAPFEGITKSVLTLVTTLGMLNLGKRASRGMVMGGVGWWKGEKTFTQGFGEGFTTVTKSAEKAGGESAKAFSSTFSKVFKSSTATLKKDGNLAANVLKESFGINRIKKNMARQIGNEAIIARMFPEKSFDSQAKKDADIFLNRLRAELKSGKVTEVEAEVKIKQHFASNKGGGLVPGVKGSEPKIDATIIDALKNGEQHTKRIGTGFTGLASKIDSAGASLMNFGLLLEGTPLQPFGTLLSTVGMALTTFGGSMASLKASFLEAWAGATLENAALAEQAGLTTAAEVATLSDAAANGTLTASEIMAAGGAMVLKTALIEIVLPLMAIAAVIGVAVVAFKKLDEAIETPKEKMERMTDAAAKASEAFDSAKQETSELNDAINQIQTNDSAFDGLVAGTTEFNEKLVEANQKISELVSKYPMLTEYLSTDSNGLMHISDEGIKKVQEEQKRRQGNAAALNAIQNAQLAREENERKAAKLEQAPTSVTSDQDRRDYEKNKEKAQYLRDSAEAAEKVAQQTAIASSLSGEEVNNREKISAIYASQYDDLKAQAETQKASIDEMRQAYADFYGYNYDRSTKEITDVEGNVVLTKDDDEVIKDAFPDITVITNFEANAASLDSMINTIDQKVKRGLGSSFKDSGDLFTDILAGNFETDEDAVQELLQDPGKLTEQIQNLSEKEIAALMGLSEEDVQVDPEKFKNELINKAQTNLSSIGEAQQKSYNELIGMMAQSIYGTTDRAMNVVSDAKIEGVLKKTTAEQAHMMSNIGATLRDNVGSGAMSTFIQEASDIYLSESTNTIKKFDELIKGINFESPTSRLEGYNKAIQSSDKDIQHWGNSMRNSVDEANILGESFDEFLGGDWTELQENVDDFQNSMGQIDADGILKAAESSKTLKTLLDSGEVSASAVASALQGIQDGEYSIGAVNSTVLLLLSNMNKLTDVAREAHGIIQNFDAGIDTGEGEDFVKENASSARELYENGEVGNEQLQNYIKLAAGTERWNKALRENKGDLGATADELMKYVTTFEDGFGPAWEQMINGQSIDGKTLTEKIKSSDIESSLKDKFSEVKFFAGEDGYLDMEIGDLTTDELETYFEKIYGVSDEYAKLLLQDLSNYDATLSTKLRANDIQGLAESGQLRTDKNGNTILTDEELNILKTAGVNLEEFAKAAGTTKEALENSRFDVMEGDERRDASTGTLLRDYAEIFRTGQHNISSLFGVKDLQTNGTFDLQKLMTDTVAKGMDDEQAIQSAYKAWKVAENEGTATTYNGQELDLDRNASIDDFRAAIEKVTDNSQWVTVGETIGQAIVNALQEWQNPTDGYEYTPVTETAPGMPSNVPENKEKAKAAMEKAGKEIVEGETTGILSVDTGSVKKAGKDKGKETSEDAGSSYADGLKSGDSSKEVSDAAAKAAEETRKAGEHSYTRVMNAANTGNSTSGGGASGSNTNQGGENKQGASTKNVTVTADTSDADVKLDAIKKKVEDIPDTKNSTITVTQKYSTEGKKVKAKDQKATISYTASKTIKNEPGNLEKEISYTANKKIKNEPTDISRTINYSANVPSVGDQYATLHLNLSSNSKNFKVTPLAKGQNNKIPYAPLPMLGSLAKGTRYGRIGPKDKGGLTLTGEEGFEIAWLPSESRSMILGADGPQMLNLPDDAVVYTHEQSKKILKKRQGIPAGSHRDVSATRRRVSGADSSSDSNTPSKTTSKGKKPKGRDDKEDKDKKEVTKKVKQITGKVSVWWDNISRKIDSRERKTQQAASKFESLVNRYGITFKEIAGAANNYKKNLNATITLNKKVVSKYTAQLNKLDKGRVKQTIKYEKKVAKKDSKGKTKVEKKTVDKKVNLSKYVKKNGQGVWVIDPKAINRVGKRNKSEAKAIKEAANKYIDNRLSKINSAQDKLTKAREEATKLSNTVYEMFYGWEKSLTKLFLLTKQIELLSGKQDIFSTMAEAEYSRLLAGVGESDTTTIERITDSLTEQAKILVSKIELNSKSVDAARDEYENALNVNKWKEAFKNDFVQGSTTAFDDAQAYTDVLKIINNAGFGTEKFDIDSAYEAVKSAYRKGGVTKLTDDKLKEFLEKIVEKQQNYYDALKQSFESEKEYYDFIENLQGIIENFEDELISGLEQQNQEQIDKLEKLDSSLNKSMKDLLDEVKKDISERRQREDNAKTERDISQKQQRLALLRADTSGGHAVEIAQLEKEIADSQQNYQRTLEDQLLQSLQDQADEASVQRQHQIELLNAQNEIAKNTNLNVERVRFLMSNPENNKAEIRELWLQSKGYDEKALMGQTNIEEEFEKYFTEVVAAYNAYNRLKNESLTFTNTDGKIVSVASAVETTRTSILNKLTDMQTNGIKISSDSDFNKALLGLTKNIATLGVPLSRLIEQYNLGGGPKASSVNIARAAREKGYSLKTVRTELKNRGKKLGAAGAAQAGYGAGEIAKNYGVAAALKTSSKESKVGKAIQKNTGKSTESIVKTAKKTNTLSKVSDLDGSAYKKIDTNGKKKGGKVTSHFEVNDETNKSKLTYNKGTDFFIRNVSGKDVSWHKYPISKLTEDQVRNYVDARDALRNAIQGIEPGGLINKNFKKLIKAAGYVGKKFKLKNGTYAHIGGDGQIYYSGVKDKNDGVYIWDAAGQKLKFDKYNKDKFIKKAKSENIGEEYKAVLHKKKVKGYATGGIADFTGPAWLDGTPSKPELVLNAADTKNFLALKDVLSRAVKAAGSLDESSGGDATYEININVDHISNDYDVDKIAKRVGKIITTNSSYRNVTQVRNLR